MHLWYTQMKYYRIRFALWIISSQKLFWDMTLFADSVINLSGGLFVFVLFQNVIELSIYPFNNQSSTFNTYSNNIIMNCNLIIYRYIIYIYIYILWYNTSCIHTHSTTHNEYHLNTNKGDFEKDIRTHSLITLYQRESQEQEIQQF